MYRPASRALLRTAQSSLAPGRTIPGRRFLTTEPPHLRSRSWKSSAARWGLAIAGIYFYNTSPVFADQPALTSTHLTDASVEDASLPTLDALAQKDRSKQRQSSVLESAASVTTSETITHEPSTGPTSSGGSPADLEEEASQEGAFNPETGEINWDCPCLGGMAHGPCGEDFKAAFSCFVFSTEEPKGMDCIDNFKKMQDCFREHPDVYAGELADDDDEDGVMAEGLGGEKAELEREVQERRKSVQERQAQRQSTEGGEAEPQRRLLEEAPAASSTKPARKSSTAQKKTQPQPPTHSEPTHQTASDTADESRETLSGPAPSQLTKKPYTTPVQDTSSASASGSGSGSGSLTKQPESNVDKFDADLELQPKAWHDARDAQAKEAEQKK